MGGIITPHVHVDTSGALLFFFGGPMQYNRNWQDNGICYVLEKKPEAFVATPRKVESSALLGHILQAQRDNCPSQRPWENKYMRLAREEKNQKGCLIFLGLT
jgi:hypothetical protein